MPTDALPPAHGKSHGGAILWGLLAGLFIGATLTIAIWSSDHQGMPSSGKVTRHISTRESRPVPTPTSTIPAPPHFETGMVYPEWYTGGYGPTDIQYAPNLAAIATQTHSRWLELPLLFKMQSPSSLSFDTSAIPTPFNLEAGIVRAHSYGFSLFLVPLVTVEVPGGWSGMVSFSSSSGAHSWFESFYAAYAPYLMVAQKEHVEQVSIGTELEKMQRDTENQGLWQNYISQVRETYTGTLTYDMNWSDITDSLQPWMHSLDTLGVSEYIPMVPSPQRVSEAQMPALFRTNVEERLDALSLAFGRPIIVSELGYRASFDALYDPWDSSIHHPLDASEQASIYHVALTLLSKDPHIKGVFCWGWNNTGAFDLHDTQAALQIGQVYEQV